jgi:hypothetical protein
MFSITTYAHGHMQLRCMTTRTTHSNSYATKRPPRGSAQQACVQSPTPAFCLLTLDTRITGANSMVSYFVSRSPWPSASTKATWWAGAGRHKQQRALKMGVGVV